MPVTQQNRTLSGYSLIDFGQLPMIDEKSLSARFRICTNRRDREGDSIEPSGVTWDDYAHAPVVKYEHGFTGVPFPVATSLSPEGVLYVEYLADEDAIYARAFHSEKNELSAQTFGLIVEGFLRAASIHVLPTAGYATQRADGSTHAKQSTILEWSECTVAVNPDAYAKALVSKTKLSEVLNLQLDAASRILEKGQVCGLRLLPSLAKSLKAVLPKGKAMENGFGDGVQLKTLSSKQVAQLSPAGLVKALIAPEQYDSTTLGLLRAKAKAWDQETIAKMLDEDEELEGEEVAAEEDSPEEDSLEEGEPEEELVEDATPEDSPSPPSPQGAQYLQAIHREMLDVLAKCGASDHATEKPEVKKYMEGMCQRVQGEILALEGAYTLIYPNAGPLTAEEPVQSPAMVKAWMAKNPRSQFQLEGLAARLEIALRAVPSGSKAKSVVSRTIRDLRLLGSQAKSLQHDDAARPGSGVAEAQDDNQAMLQSLAKAVDDLAEKINKMPA